MKIVGLKTYIVENPPPSHGLRLWNFVKLTTDDGIEGIGEPWGVGFEPEVVDNLLNAIGGQYFIDADPFQIERIWRRVYGGGFSGAGKICILSALEQACWDIIGKALDQPVYNLLGGKYHEKIRSYTYLYPPSDVHEFGAMEDAHHVPNIAAERAAAYLKMGFTAVKFDPIYPQHYVCKTLSCYSTYVGLGIKIPPNSPSVLEKQSPPFIALHLIITEIEGHLSIGIPAQGVPKFNALVPPPPPVISQAIEVERGVHVPGNGPIEGRECLGTIFAGIAKSRD